MTLLQTTLVQAQRRRLSPIELRSLALLGTLALAAGDHASATQWLEAGLEKLEQLRSTLPSEEFRIAYLADKASLYHGLIALALAAGQTVRAFHLLERSRSLTLLELIDGTLPLQLRSRDAFEAALLEWLARCRSELNWFYHQLHHRPASDERPSPATMSQLRQAADEREQEILAILRQLQQRADQGAGSVDPAQEFSLAELQNTLGSETALIEFCAVNEQLTAFVVTATNVHLVENLGRENEVAALVRQFRFQIDTLRHGRSPLQEHLGQLRQRCNHYLQQLYQRLIRPLEGLLGQRRLVIVPHHALHYVPFPALWDGQHYLTEQVEVCLAPSAGVLHHVLHQERKPLERALLVGVADEQAPAISQEIALLETLFPQAQTLLNQSATVDAVCRQSPTVDLLHLACHSLFRPDNPMFSALKLADGWLTMREAYSLQLTCSLVTLSACETGMNAVYPGEELIGLVRGFFAAGAPALLVSLWPVDDETTVSFMRHFYRALLAGNGSAAALRTAQCALLAHSPHPFFWSPFVLFGRWD
jgi:CHAT domain-containing protein